MNTQNVNTATRESSKRWAEKYPDAESIMIGGLRRNPRKFCHVCHFIIMTQYRA